MLCIALAMSLIEQQTTLSRGSGPGSPEEPSTGPRTGEPSTDNEHSLNNQSQGHDLTAKGNSNANVNANRESGHDTLANEPAALTEEDRQKEDATGTNPDFSLAGPYNNPQNIYISPQYRELDPNYDKPHDEPLWSLAQPFPRVVRPGMRMRGEKGEDVAATQTVSLFILGGIGKGLMIHRERRKKHSKLLHRLRRLTGSLGKEGKRKIQRIKFRNRSMVNFLIHGVVSGISSASSWVNYLE